MMVVFAGCGKTSNLPSQVFSPHEAGTGLLNAAKAGDPNAVLAVFGPESKATFSGDAVQVRPWLVSL